MLIPTWFAILYPAAIIVSLFMLYASSKQYPQKKHYSILSRSISGLGNKKYKSCKLFREDIFFIPVINIILIYFLYLSLAKTTTVYVGIAFLIIGEISTILTSFATEDFTNKRKFITHFVFSIIAFLFTIVGLIILAFVFKDSTIFKQVVPFNFLPIIFGILAGIAAIYNLKYAPDVKKPLFKNIDLWEWMMFFSIILCFVLIYFSLLLA